MKSINQLSHIFIITQAIILINYTFAIDPLLAGDQVLAGDQGIKFAVISDHRDDYNGLQNALTFLHDEDLDFIIVAGDFEPLMETYLNYYAPMGFEVREDRAPEMQDVYFVLGNHDGGAYGEPFFQENIAPHYPRNGPQGAPRGTIFSFDRGNVHFVMTNQYWNFSKGGYTDEQLDWIDADLMASTQPFKFIIGHEPAFPMDRHVGDSLDANTSMRDEFWDILSANGSQAYFCGHTHHLSIIKNQNVYQIDTGQIGSSYLSFVIVEVDAQMAVARLYETNNAIPEAPYDNIFLTSIREIDRGDAAYALVYSSDNLNGSGGGGSNGSSCFIDAMAH